MIEKILASIGENLFVAIIGGAVTILSGAMVEKYQRFRLEKKYPIKGEYLSEFEDVVNGEKTIIKAPVTLTQKGKCIKGTSEIDGRTWILDGEISEDGYLFGIYYAESVHDKGVGNFFLEINIDGDMEGLWSGYDAVNKTIMSGRYSFIRKRDFKIARITKRQVPAVLSIAEKQLGAAYINVEDLLAEENVACYASISGKIVGFCTGKQIALDKIYESIPQLREMKLKQLATVETLGMVASVATDPDYAGRGIGSALVEHCIAELEKKDFNVLAMTGWKSPKGVHIGSIAKNYGFKEVLEVPDFWKEDSLKHGYACPVCGQPPCRCSAVVYLRHSSN